MTHDELLPNCPCGAKAKYRVQFTDPVFKIFYQYFRCEEHEEWGVK